MRRTASPLRSWFVFAGLAVAVSGCEIMPDPEFAALKGALTLSMVGQTQQIWRVSRLQLHVDESGERGAKACLGPRAVCPTRSRHRVASAAHL